MSPQVQSAMLVRVDRYSWYFFIGWFAAALVLNVAEIPAGHMMTFGGVLLILANNFVRLVIVAEQFRAPGKGRYRLLGYVLILALAAAAGIQIMLRGTR